MKKEKHTPGPWIVSKYEPNIVWCRKGDNEPGICDTAAPTIEQVTEKEAEANALLISAAPELLESCKEMADILNSYAHRIQNGPDVITRALAAIGKARGQEMPINTVSTAIWDALKGVTADEKAADQMEEAGKKLLAMAEEHRQILREKKMEAQREWNEIKREQEEAEGYDDTDDGKESESDQAWADQPTPYDP